MDCKMLFAGRKCSFSMETGQFANKRYIFSIEPLLIIENQLYSQLKQVLAY